MAGLNRQAGYATDHSGDFFKTFSRVSAVLVKTMHLKMLSLTRGSSSMGNTHCVYLFG